MLWGVSVFGYRVAFDSVFMIDVTFGWMVGVTQHELGLEFVIE